MFCFEPTTAHESDSKYNNLKQHCMQIVLNILFDEFSWIIQNLVDGFVIKRTHNKIRAQRKKLWMEHNIRVL